MSRRAMNEPEKKKRETKEKKYLMSCEVLLMTILTAS